MPEEFVEDIIKGSTEEVDNSSGAEEIKAEETEIEKVEEKVGDSSEQVSDANDVADDVSDAADNASIEALAEKIGWNKNHQGPEKIDAATYILRSREIQDTMRGHNKDLKSQLKSLHSSIDALQEHNENVYKAEVKKLQSELTRLKKEKRAAVELADVDKVDELDEQIEGIQNDLNKPQKTETVREVENPVYDEWIEDNQWYEQDDDMAAYADNVAMQYQGAPLERIYDIVRQKVQEVFPEKFKQSEKVETNNTQVKTEKPVTPPSPVEGATKRTSGSSFTVNDLTDSQRATMRQFVGMGVMTEEQYINDIAKMQEG